MLIYLNAGDRKSLSVNENNVLSDFTITMPTPIELTGKWEMGLVQIQFPLTWKDEKYENVFLKYNVEFIHNGDVRYEDFNVIIENVISKNIDEIIYELNMSNSKIRFTRTDDGYIELNVVTSDFFPPGSDWDQANLKRIELSNSLGDILGFGENKHNCEGIYNYITRSILHPFMPHTLSTIAVHCDLIEAQIVSSSYQKILRAVPVKQTNEKFQTVTYQNPRYVNIKHSSFSYIRIQLLDMDGERIQFEGGTVVLCVDIRPLEKHHITF